MNNTNPQVSVNALDELSGLDAIFDEQTQAEKPVPQAPAVPEKKLSRLETNIKQASKKVSEVEKIKDGENIVKVDPNLVDANRFQNRKRFKNIIEMAESIKSKGQISPCVVRRCGSRYELVVGERRLRACKENGIPTLDVLIREYTDQEMLELCGAENDEREDTSIPEKCINYLMKRDQFEMGHIDIINSTSKLNNTTYWRIIRLEHLPRPLLNDLAGSRLSEKLNSVHAESIGFLFRDNEDHIDDLEKLLRYAMESVEHTELEDTKLATETNLTIKNFLKQAKKVCKNHGEEPNEPVKTKPKNQKEIVHLVLDNAKIAEIITTSETTSVVLSKKDLPQDVYEELMNRINGYFEEIKASKATPE